MFLWYALCIQNPKTVQSPRYGTLKALYHAFSDGQAGNDPDIDGSMVGEENRYYAPGSTAAAEYILSKDGRTGKTLDDYMALPEGTRIELIDGVFYDMAGPTVIHQRIACMIDYAFERFINENGGSCIPSIAPTDVRLDCDDKTMVQPDVLVVCDRSKVTKQRIEGLSSSHWYNDMILKMEKYKNAGVREYWIVVPEQQAVLVYHFEKTAEAAQYTFEDQVPVGIWDGKCKVDFKKILENIQFLL